MTHRLECFGRVTVHDPDGDRVRLRSRKHLGLLLYLASHTRRRHQREKLASLFWESEPRLARHSLSQALYDIRTHLPEFGLDASVNHVAVEENGLRYEAVEFEEAVRSEDLGRAVSLYDGDFAPDLEGAGTQQFERWVERERQRFHRLAEMALYRYVRECDDEARWGEMCVSASRLLDMNPLNEEAHAALMRGLWLQGDQGAALQHFDEVEDFLEAELPGGISAETRDLVRRIRTSKPVSPDAHAERGEPVRMVGRGEEFRRLQRALEATREGNGGLVLVRGEAGMGKTRLLEELGGLAALEECRVLTSRCYASETTEAFGPVVDGIEGLAGELAEEVEYFQLGHLLPEVFGPPEIEPSPLGDRKAGRRRLFEEVADLLRRASEAAPVVWMVEDLHWIDASSAALLHYLVRRLSDHRFLLVVTVRSQTDLGEPAESFLRDLSDIEHATLELEPLSPAEIQELLTSAHVRLDTDREQELVHRLAGGNPHYALELTRSPDRLRQLLLDAETDRGSGHLLTDNLNSLLRGRLRGLPPEAIRILEVVAVAGRHATPPVVAAAAGLRLAVVAEMARSLYTRGLMTDEDGRLEFLHEISREYVYGNMGRLQQAALHLATGEVLAGSRHEVSPRTLADHFRKGGDAPRAYEYAIRAAEDAEQAFGHREAISLASVALEEARTGEERARALKLLSRAELAAGRLGEAESHLEDLVNLGLGTPEETARLKLEIARAKMELSQWEDALSLLDGLEEEIGGLEGSERYESRMLGLKLRLKIALRRRDSQTARDVVRKVEELREQVPEEEKSPLGEALALLNLAGYSIFAESSVDGLDYLNAVEASTNDLPRDLVMEVQLLLGGAALRLARWDQAETNLESALEDARKYNDVLMRANVLNSLSCCALERGDWERVRRLNQEIQTTFSALPRQLYFRISPSINLADAHWYAGDTRRAEALFEETLEVARSFEVDAFLPTLHASLALVHYQSGTKDSAERHAAYVAEIDLEEMSGVQDRFKALWLNAFLTWHEDPPEAVAKLMNAADREESADTASALKLRCLAQQMRRLSGLNGRDRLEGIKEDLREHDLGWFSYFSRRWVRQALPAEEASAGDL